MRGRVLYLCDFCFGCHNIIAGLQQRELLGNTAVRVDGHIDRILEILQEDEELIKNLLRAYYKIL